MWILVSVFSLVIAVFFLAIKWEFNFDSSSIWILFLRFIFESLQTYLTLKAIVSTDRSTFNIIKILTLPLLIVVDIILGYNIAMTSIVWMWIIVASFLYFNLKEHTLNLKGSFFVFASTFNALITISLCKELITNYNNSFEVVQIIWAAWSIIFLAWLLLWKREKVEWKILKDKMVLWGLICYWIWTLLASYWYTLMNASEATTILRIWAMFSGLLLWYLVFKEDNIKSKVTMTLTIVVWVIIMTLG